MRAHLRTLAILACTAGLLALFLRNANLAEVGREVRGARPGLLVLSVLVQGLTYLFRARRWQVLLEPVGAAHLSTALRTTVIGYAANSLLPARAGEVLRPYLLARREGLRATAAFATIIVERFLDLATVALLFGVFVVAADAATLEADPKLFAAVRAGGVLAALLAVGVLVVFAVLAGHPERLGALTNRLTRALPARIGKALVHAVRTFAEGLAVMRRPALVGRAFVLSLPLWLSIAAGIWLVARAFHITIPFTGAFLILALLTVGVAVPTPGAVGGFHYAFRVGATVFYGVPNERAVGAAIVLHAVSFLPVALVGLVFMARDGLTLGGLRHMAAQPADAVAGPAEAPAGEPPPGRPADAAQRGPRA
jgi:uncharacterized protein (TIRG00374 family)